MLKPQGPRNYPSWRCLAYLHMAEEMIIPTPTANISPSHLLFIRPVAGAWCLAPLRRITCLSIMSCWYFSARIAIFCSLKVAGCWTWISSSSIAEADTREQDRALPSLCSTTLHALKLERCVFKFSLSFQLYWLVYRYLPIGLLESPIYKG